MNLTLSKSKAYHASRIGNSRVSDMLPYLKFIATEYSLKLSNLPDFLLAKKILTIYTSDN